LSVLRDGASNAEFEETLTELQARATAAGNPCHFHGILAFLAANVRFCASDRFLCVFDTALEKKPHHADLMRKPFPTDWTKSKTEKERMILVKELRQLIGSGFVAASRFRDGAFVSFAKQ